MNTKTPADLTALYLSWREVTTKYRSCDGYYDMSHSDQVKDGIRFKKLRNAIEAQGLDLATTLARLTQENMDQ